MKKIRLTLTAVNAGEESRFLYSALLTEFENGFLLKYTAEGAEVSVRLHKKRLTVTRNDGTVLRFEEGKTLPGRYAVGPFFSAVTVKTDRLSVEKERFSVRYTVDFSGETVESSLLFGITEE